MQGGLRSPGLCARFAAEAGLVESADPVIDVIAIKPVAVGAPGEPLSVVPALIELSQRILLVQLADEERRLGD